MAISHNATMSCSTQYRGTQHREKKLCIENEQHWNSIINLAEKTAPLEFITCVNIPLVFINSITIPLTPIP